MPQCHTCDRCLPGSWKDEGLGETGGRLGTNGYFLSDGTINWMNCYCKRCWEQAVFDLGFVQVRIGRLEQQLSIAQHSEKQLILQLTNCQAQNASLQQQLNKFSTVDVENLKNLLKQFDTEQTVILQNVGGFSIDEFDYEHHTEQHKIAKQLVEEAINKLKVGVVKVIQYQIDTLAKRQEGLGKCMEVMSGAGMPKEIINSHITGFQKHIEEESSNLEKWRKFQGDLEVQNEEKEEID